MSGPALDILHLRKRYGRFEALAGVALSVPAGSVFGLLGPNGAGKSTLVKSLLTILRPAECSGTLLGQPIGHRPTLARVGYLPEHARFPEYLTGRQIIGYSAGLARVPAAETRRRTAALLDRIGMAEWADRKLGTYSKGMRQRIGLAQALVNEPDLVILDEPTDGVDPGGRIEIRRIIESIRDEGRTVFLNSHLLAEVEQVADHVAILSRGKIVESGRVEELTRRGCHYELRTMGPVPPSVRETLEKGGLRVAGDLVALDAPDAAPLQPVIDALRAAGVPIREIREVRKSLEDLFLESVRIPDPSAPR